MEIAETVTDVDVGTARHGHLQGKHLVEGFQVAALVQEVGSQTDPDVEIGHHELGTGRDAERQLPVDAGFLHRQVGAAAHLHDLVGDGYVGAAVVHAVERHACTELVAEVIHRGEVESQNRVGIRRGILLVAHFDAFAPPRAEEREVVAEMARECGADRPRGHFGRFPSEIVGQARAQSHGVESRVGEFGVAVGEVREAQARREVHLARDAPVEEEIGVEIGVHLRTHHLVEGVHGVVVGFPAEREAEIPFIVERQPRADPCDARALEQVDGDRVSEFVGVSEVVVSGPDALIGAAVNLVGD